MKKQRRDKDYVKKLVGMCSGQVSQGMEAAVIAQLTFYLTESVLISASIVGFLLLAVRIFDGVTDAVAGFLIDRTKTRWGKARPYFLLFIPMWVAMVLIYSVPNINVKLQVAYVFVLYIIIEAVGRTCVLCANTVIVKRALYEEDQVNALTISALATYFFALVSGVLIPILIALFGQTKEGWTIIALIFAVPCTILGVLEFLLVKEFDSIEVEKDAGGIQTVPLKKGVKILFKNPYVFIFGLVFFVYNISAGVGNSSGTYYFTYIIGDVSKLSFVTLIGFTSLVVMFFLPALSKKMGTTNLIRLGMFMVFIGNAAKYLFPTNIMMLGICGMVATAGLFPIMTLATVINIDCMKYSYWQTGVPVEGIIASVNGVATKLGTGLGSALIGILMAASGYEGNLSVQSASANHMISFLYIGVPALCGLAGFIIMMFYRLDKKMPQIEAELAEREKHGTVAS